MKLLVFMLCVWLKLGVPNVSKEKENFESFSYNGCFDHINPNKRYVIQIDSNRAFYLMEEQKNTNLLKTKNTPSIKFVLSKEEYVAFLQKLNAVDFSDSPVYIYDICTPSITVSYTSSIAHLTLLKKNPKADQLLLSLVFLKDKYKIIQKSNIHKK